MCAVKPEGVPQLCKADEIGELCVCTVATGTAYYGLAGMTKNTFEVRLRLHLFTGLVEGGAVNDFHRIENSQTFLCQTQVVSFLLGQSVMSAHSVC